MIKSIPDTPQELRAELLKKGLTISRFAKENGFNVHTTRKVIDGTHSKGKVSNNIRERLKEVIDE